MHTRSFPCFDTEVPFARRSARAVRAMMLAPGLLMVATATPAFAENTLSDPASGPSEQARAWSEPTKPLPQPASTDRLSFDGGAELVSQYIARGVTFSDQPSLQPFASATLSLPSWNGGSVSDAHLTIGAWASFQSGNPGAGQRNGGSLRGWYEGDLYVSLGAVLAKKLTVATSFYHYTSPAHSYGAYNEFQLSFRYDDSGAWAGVPLRDFSVSPSLLVAREQGRPFRKDATYVEPSLSPSFSVGSRDNPARLTIPLILGISDNYFDGKDGGKKTFGYFRTGFLLAGKPFPKRVSALSLDGGVDLWLLNNQVANGLKPAELVAHVGLSVHF